MEIHRILLVEDDVKVKKSIKDIFNEYQVYYDECTSEQASIVVKEYEYHFVLLGSGLTLDNYNEIMNLIYKLNYKYCKVIVLSKTVLTKENLARLFELNIFDVIEASPMALEVLARKINNHFKYLHVKEDVEFSNDKLISIVGKELNSSLGFIKTLADLIYYTGMDMAPEAKDLCKKIAHNAEESVRLISNISDLRKFERSQFKLDIQRFKFNDLVNEVVKFHTPTSEQKNIDIIVDNTVPTVLIEADYGRIFQLMSNLIKNACHFSPENTDIFIRFKMIEEENIYNLKREVLKCEVVDRGRGIIESKLGTIFEKFYQLNPMDSDAGIGLGLSICRKICLLHHGQIWAESIGEGKGSTFAFTIPLESRQGIAPRKIQNVLVCDDSEDIRFLLSKDIQKLGYQVVTAKDGKEAIEMIKNDSIDIIFTDINMPVQGGIVTIKQVRQMGLDIPTIIITNSINSSELEEVYQYADDIIYKPIKDKELNQIFTKYDSTKKLVEQNVTNEETKNLILVVDDEPDVRDILTETLVMSDYDVKIAKSAAEALFLIHKFEPQLVLTNLRLPDMSGIEFAQKIRGQDNSVPVIFSSSKISQIPRKTLKKIQMGHLVTKPFNLTDLKIKINEVLANANETVKTWRVLVVDDSKDATLILRRLLKNPSIEFYEANDHTKALELYEKNEFDLVILDNNINGYYGKDLVVFFRKIDQQKNHKTLIMGFTAALDERELMVHNGCDGIIDKPINIRTFKQEIFELLNSLN